MQCVNAQQIFAWITRICIISELSSHHCITFLRVTSRTTDEGGPQTLSG
jgi:hypothetical protein